MLKIMCGSLDGPFKRDDDAPEARTGWNIKPTQQVHTACEEDGRFTITTARWRLVPHWFKATLKEWKSNTIYARIEEASE